MEVKIRFYEWNQQTRDVKIKNILFLIHGFGGK